jgi:hypothetical protein
MIPEGIEPSIFGTGIRRVAIAPWNHSLEYLTTHRVCEREFGAVSILKKQKGAIRESNPRPPAPKAGIIPLDQSPDSLTKNCTLWDSNPRPQRGSELESDALTNSAKGALLLVLPRSVPLDQTPTWQDQGGSRPGVLLSYFQSGAIAQW